MIILTSQQAIDLAHAQFDQARLHPVKLLHSDEWVLPEGVLDDDAYIDVRLLLAELPTREVDESEWNSDIPPE